MSLEISLRLAALGELEDSLLNLLLFKSPKNTRVLSYLRENEILDDDSLDKSLEEGVINVAKTSYSLVFYHGIRPDHLARPEFFVYAIQKKTFSEKELEKVQFDHGDNLETFCKRYKKDNLLEDLKAELFNVEYRPI